MKGWVSAIGAAGLLNAGVAGWGAPAEEVDLDKWCAETESKVRKLGEEFKRRIAVIQPLRKEEEKELKKSWKIQIQTSQRLRKPKEDGVSLLERCWRG